MISAGDRSIQGTSGRTPRQDLLVRHSRFGSQVKPDSISTSSQRRELLEHALGEEAQQLRFERGRLRDIILDAMGRPARRHRRMAVGAAGVDADGEPELFRGGVDRPIGSAAQQHVAHREQQHLDEAAVRRHALDLGDRVRGIVHRHQDRRAQPRLAVEQFLPDPVVDGGAERHRHVLVEQRDRAMQHVADGEAGAERIERLAADHVEVPPGAPDACRQSGRALSGEFGG